MLNTNVMYGCGDEKLASTLGKPKSQGKKLKKIFWDNNPALQHLIADLEAAYDKNGWWIRGLDGRMLFVREKRKLLNSLLQNAATIIFKKWMVNCEGVARANAIFKQIIAYHDELQFEALTKDEGTITMLSSEIKRCAKDAGLCFKLNVPIDADVKRGRDWSQCH